jgi:prepilin-type processing-associated H-X9-DG protein
MKQIGLGLVGYSADNDEKFPSVIGAIQLSDGKVYEQQWGITTKATISGKETSVPSVIDGYMRNQGVFQCPLVKTSSSGLTYLYNDLAANESQGSMSGVANSVLIADGDDHLRNTGHARAWSHQGAEAVFLPNQNGVAPKLLIGAAIGDASIRHQGGGFYGFADGHVKWMKPDVVFFPPRTSNSSSHREAETGRLLGPDPAGATKDGMTFAGTIYTATFHVR